MKTYLIAASLVLSACTTYRPAGFGGGYSDIMIAPDTAYVKYQGSDLSSPQRVAELLLTIQHGFHYFSAENWADESSTESITFPGSVTSSATVTGTEYGNAFSAYGTENSIVRPPSTVRLNRPAGGVTIRMGDDQSALASETGHRVFDAAFIFAQVQ